MNNFIYVFSKDARDILLARGYTLLKSDEARGMYVFANEMMQTFSDSGFRFVLSDKLTF